MTLHAALSLDVEALRARQLAPVSVAILDSGVDATHPWLAGRVDSATSLALLDGRVDVLALDPTLDNALHDHGTAVAGVVAGLAPNARLHDVRILQGLRGDGRLLVRGLELALERGARVLNVSTHADARHAPDLASLCERAYVEGRVVVAACRNVPLQDAGFPASLTATVSVDRWDAAHPSLVRYRPDDVVEFDAQGERVRVAVPGGGTTLRTGSSIATPTVSALCTLLLGAFPDLRPFEVKAWLKAHAAVGRGGPAVRTTRPPDP